MTRRETKSSNRSIIYCRVSDIKQATIRGDGLNSQEQVCREFARHNGLEVVAVFSDTMTGGQSDREGLESAFSYLRKHPGTFFIVDHANRMARDLLDHLLMVRKIEDMGGILKSPNMDFGPSASQKLVEHMMASVSHYHRTHNAEQTKSRMKGRVLGGFWPFMAPAGYKHHRVSGSGNLLRRDEPVASILAEAFEGFASGRFGSQAEVRRFLEAQPDFPKSPRGFIPDEKVQRTLRNILYAGYVAAPNWDVSLRKGVHEPLISLETFKAVQDRLDWPAAGFSDTRLS